MSENKNYRYAVVVIATNVVDNIIVWDEQTEWGPGKGYTAIKLEDDQFCDIGAIYDKETNTFSYPPGHDPY